MTKLLAVLVLFLVPYSMNGRNPLTSENQQESTDSGIAADVEGQLLTPSGDWSFAGNLKQILTAVRKQWREQTASLALSGAKGIVGVEFWIQKNGSEVDGSEKVVRSSGDARLNELAFKAIHSASPFEPLPDSYSGTKARVVIFFSYGTHLPKDAPPQSIEASKYPTVAIAIDMVSDDGGVDFNAYLREVYSSVYKNWVSYIPRSIEKGLQGKNTVEFHILQHGNVPKDSLKMIVSSGKDELDAASLGAVREAAPFNPLPEKFSEPFIVLRMTFYYNLKPEKSQ